jgi:shikimate kinase
VRVYLTGFMGSGKSAAGMKLAERLGVPFLDLDEEIERRAGMTVREIFERQGEPEFRRLEQELLRATGDWPDVVVATGGGTVTFDANARWIRANGVSVWLNPAFGPLPRAAAGRPAGGPDRGRGAGRAAGGDRGEDRPSAQENLIGGGRCAT